MSKRQNNNVVYYVSVIIIVLFFGCSVEQTHKTLTFFFDGVDKAIFFNDYLSKDSISKDAIARREGLLKKVRPDLCVHQPFKERKCDKCHTPDKRLLMPMPGLCYQCHKDFTTSYTSVHGPVASGNCIKCHNQHSSKYAKLLTRQGQQVCIFCHNSTLVFANKVHRDIEDAECTLCHNPHGGKNRFMIKNNIPRDANRIALMSELTSRHLYAQIFCKEPGDITKGTEIKIYNSDGILVATARPDNSGKFLLTNLHPDQNYTFKFNNGIPDCKINVMDSKGNVVFVIERKKGKYVFDKTAYEAVHDAINTANEGGGYLEKAEIKVNADQPVNKDTAVKGGVVVPPNKAAEPIVEDVVPAAEKIHDVAAGKNKTPDKPVEKAGTEDKKEANKPLDAVPAANEVTTENRIDSVGHKGKIVVKTLPGTVSAKDESDANKVKEKNKKPEKDTTSEPVYKGKIKVKTLPGTVSGKDVTSGNKMKEEATNAAAKPTDTTVYKGKIVVQPLPDNVKEKSSTRKLSRNAGATEAIRRYEKDNVTLVDLATQIGRLYDGTTVCVLNDSADYIDIAPVSKKGRFVLFDFLSYRITMPDSSSGIVSQTIFLNEKMEVIETINKRISNGRFIYVSNTREPGATKATIKLYADKENASLFTTIFYEQAKAIISSAGIAELDKVVKYLKEHTGAKVYLAAHTDSRGSIGYNQRLSLERVKSAYDYLVLQGIKKSRISGKGYGETKPLDTYMQASESEEALQKNRCVEVYIKDK